MTGLAALLLRLAILPFCPSPFLCSRRFQLLLAAYTFASGRLANPTPAMWKHFETSRSPCSRRICRCTSPRKAWCCRRKAALGNPWYGLLLRALMCAAICWMLQAWLPPPGRCWAEWLAVLHWGFSAIGSIPIRAAVPSRPWVERWCWERCRELLTASAPARRPAAGNRRRRRGPQPPIRRLPLSCRWPCCYVWLFFRRQSPSPAALLRPPAPWPLIVAAIAWLGYYDYRAFGNPLTLPYTVDRNTYAIAPYFVWQAPRPEPAYRHEMMRRFYHEHELVDYERLHARVLYQSFIKAFAGTLFFAGFALLPPLLMFRRVLLDRRTRFLVICLAALMAGLSIQIFLIPHYLAPFTAVLTRSGYRECATCG